MNIDTDKVIVIESKFAKLKNKLEHKHYNARNELSLYDGPGSGGSLMTTTEIKINAIFGVLCELLDLLDECVTDSGKKVE